MASNGRLPASMLAPIPGGRLQKGAAGAWNAMSRESQRRFGVTLRPRGPVSSYRTYGQQQYFWNLYRSGRGNLAAYPGQSNHGWGLAVDIASPGMRSIVDKIGAQYGWAKRWSDAPGEWWHLKYRPGIYKGGNPGLATDPNATLRRGARGKPVLRLKRLLRRHGYELADTNFFGDGTIKAVRDFQRRHNLTVDGIVGPATWRRLRRRKRGQAAATTTERKPKGKPTLSPGERGPWVRRLQRALARAGQPVAADGDFGPATRAAVLAFQRTQSLDADGVVGKQTWRALGRAAKAAKPDKDGSPDRELSDAGARLIAKFEGFRSNLYNDAAGHCTIGYGHLVHHGRCNGREPAEFRRGISRKRALQLLKSDAASAAAAVRKSVRVGLKQHEFDALVSFVFNVGAGAFRDSTLLRRLNNGEHEAVPSELNRWVKAGGRSLPGLVNRRRAEGQVFAHGRY